MAGIAKSNYLPIAHTFKSSSVSTNSFRELQVGLSNREGTASSAM
jgi:hypothetical protein